MTLRRLLLFLTAIPVLASSPGSWEMTTYQDFLKGRFHGVALTRDGRLTLAPQLQDVFSTDQPVIWSMARTPDSSLWLATGHRGRVFRIDAAGKGTEVFAAAEPEVFAIAADQRGRVFAASSPSGKVYLLENGRATEYFTPQAGYILSLACAKDGVVYAGTGSDGKVYRITAPGQGEVWYETGQSHVTSLAVDGEGRLLAGTEPNGILYRITGKGKAFTLYDAGLPEIRAISVAADGSIYAAAMGGSLARQTAAASSTTAGATPQAAVSATTTTITVTDEAAQQGPDLKPKPPSAPATSTTPAAASLATASTTPAVEYAGVEKAALYRIRPDNSVETLWTSKEENLYDIALAGTSVFLATDQQGRVYELDASRQVRLVAETQESEALRLAASGRTVHLATGHLGKLFRIGDAPSASGEFESPVHDAVSVARWGRLSWISAGGPAEGVVFRTRSGNSTRPDGTWSEWSAPLTDGSGAQVTSPNARFVQWKAELRSPRSFIDSVRLTYLPQNGPPVVKSITVMGQTAAAGAAKAATAAPAAPAYSITITDTGEAGPSSLNGTPSQPVLRAGTEQIVITWTAEDPDGDKIVSRLLFRGDGQEEWKLLRDNLTEATHTIDAETLADGRYTFRVSVSDRLANPPATAQEAELLSSPVLIDRTPPVVRLTAGAEASVRVEAKDAGSPLTRCEYAVDAGLWTILAAEDGVVDSLSETLSFRAEGSGERVAVVRCFDSANNAGLARLILR